VVKDPVVTDPTEPALVDTSVFIATESGRGVDLDELPNAATAAAHGLPVLTQDADFDVLAEVGGIEVIRV
jgi:predicted nucleic acid-binding protein